MDLNTTEEIDEIDYSQFEEKFFEQVKSGKKYQHFLNIGSQLDCMMIRSIFSSMDIPTYIEFENINKIYGGVSTCLTSNIFSIKLYILIDDYEEALAVIKDYIRNKVELLASKQGKDKYIKILEILAAPYVISSSQEMLGITVLQKNRSEA
ncbi:MAG: hypothetical protein J6X84_08290 [Treponema sp.]|nr:hypothetical protein [Treponema sp.]